jgi:hypothetical protein
VERLETFSGNVSTPPTGAGDGVPVLVDVVEQLGADAYLYTHLTGEQSDAVRQSSDIVVRTEPSRAPAPAAAGARGRAARVRPGDGPAGALTRVP